MSNALSSPQPLPPRKIEFTALSSSIGNGPRSRLGYTLKGPAVASNDGGDARSIYKELSSFEQGAAHAATAYLTRQIEAAVQADDLPENADQLPTWMQDKHSRVADAHRIYLARRKAGGIRKYFSSRAHALYFLKSVAPAKLVDGAWVHGLVSHWKNPLFYGLTKTYMEELGNGEAEKNHVALFRDLLHANGIDTDHDVAAEMYVQGAIQLSLAHAADKFLPAIVVFNLGYEQLPLHLLITAYELNEMGIDPYYFTQHITVENADTSHAQRAVAAVKTTIPKLSDATEFRKRVRNGYRLNDSGASTQSIIDKFRIDDEIVAIFKNKRVAGQGAHSDYCCLAGKTVNDWLSQPDGIPAFLAALESVGWIKRGLPAAERSFWNLLQGERAEMFGVFSDYELQLIRDWIIGGAAAQGWHFTQGATSVTVKNKQQDAPYLVRCRPQPA